ncbi:MAG: SGNH/GDSL hydrolase family protein [Proteobacteria bacterium]|nr:SGNH/GDSL hydrolase family protein [Pseudomonadota bacterium]MBU1686229.1 SGNH/GDSL hydrolase family protein [Pseudomonadota bacterium]
MKKKNTVTILLPFLSVLFFLGIFEITLNVIGFSALFYENGVGIPFWAKNTPSVLGALKSELRQDGKLSDDTQAYEEDLTLFYKLRSNLNLTVRFYDLSGEKLLAPFPNWEIITDQHGHRIPANSPAPCPEQTVNKINIAALGGSSFFGWGLDYEKTLGGRIPELIRASTDQCINFTNYAAPGYALSQHLKILKRIIKSDKKPAFIILDPTSNADVPVNMPDKEVEAARQSPIGTSRYYISRLKTFQLMEMIISRLKPTSSTIEEGPEKSPSLPPRIPLGEYEAKLESFILLTQQNQIKLLIVGICASKNYIETTTRIALKHDLPFFDFYSFLQDESCGIKESELADSRIKQLENIYGKELLAEKKHLKILFPDTCHPNETGHEILSNVVFTKIQNLGWLNQ